MKLAALFTDHAVFQRDISIPVWGWTTPHTLVKGTLNGTTVQHLSSPSGKFELRFPPMQAGGPYTLEVSQVDGTESVQVNDILVGEVWVASGQSNMEWPLDKCVSFKTFPEERFARQNIRFINPSHTAFAGKREDLDTAWTICTSESSSVCSAVAFYFAERIHEELDIPIGIINSSWGGTRIEAWTSRETLMQNPAMVTEIQLYENRSQSPSHWEELPTSGWDDPMSCLQTLNDKCFTRDPGTSNPEYATADFDDSSWNVIDLPRTWQSRGNAHTGAFWFRLTVDVDPSWAGKDLVLHLGAADKHDVTFFNGEQVGATGKDLEQAHWNIPREYSIPGNLVKAGTNVIASRVFSFFADGGLIGPAKAMKLCLKDNPETTPIALAGEWKYQCELNTGVCRPHDLSYGPGNQHSPAILYDNMIYPLLPYAIRGSIWYQGESNAGNHQFYARQMQDLVRDWRHVWGQGDFPYYIVQLANFRPGQDFEAESTWAPLREAQSRLVEIPNTGVATIIDIGEEADIHPQNKHDVGYRLAQLALANDYHQVIVPCGPTYSHVAIEGSQIRLFFDHIGSGLVAKEGELKTFYIAGPEKVFKPATATIDGATIVVSSPDVEIPTAVRYGWADNPEGCNLYNQEGFPASPFRTDSAVN